MADEITITQRLQVAKASAGLSLDRKELLQTFDMAGDAYDSQVIAVPTTAAGTAVTFATAIGTEGWCFAKNLDATNFIEIGVQVGGTFYGLIKLKPGEPALFRWSSTAPYVRADTGVANLELMTVEN